MPSVFCLPLQTSSTFSRELLECSVAMAARSCRHRRSFQLLRGFRGRWGGLEIAHLWLHHSKDSVNPWVHKVMPLFGWDVFTNSVLWVHYAYADQCVQESTLAETFQGPRWSRLRVKRFRCDCWLCKTLFHHFTIWSILSFCLKRGYVPHPKIGVSWWRKILMLGGELLERLVSL